MRTSPTNRRYSALRFVYLQMSTKAAVLKTGVMMKLSYPLAATIFVLGLLWFVPEIYGHPLITKTHVDPDVIFLNESTPVTITVLLAPGTKAGSTIRLFRRNGGSDDPKFLGL